MPTNFEQYIEWKGVQGRFTTGAEGDDPPDGFLDHEEDNSIYTEDGAGVFENTCTDTRDLVPIPFSYETL